MRGVEPLLGILLETVANDAVEARRDVLVGDGEVRRIFLEDRRHRVRGGVAVERALAGEHLVEDRAEGEDVAARVGGLAAHLLGRHVAERAEHDAGLGALRFRRQVGGARDGAFGLRQLGEAEVEDLDAPVLRDEDVLGLQVAMDDALLVRRREAVGDLRRVVDRPALRETPAGERRAERLPLEKLLDDIGRAVVAPDVVDRGDVGVVEDPGRLGLLLEAAQAVRVLREGGGQDLDGDVAREARILRPIDLAHASGADLAEDLVGTELGSGGQGHVRWILPAGRSAHRERVDRPCPLSAPRRRRAWSAFGSSCRRSSGRRRRR